MKYDYQWFWENFGPTLKGFKVVEKSFFGSMFGDSNQVEFEIEKKLLGYITLYSSGTIDLVVLDGDHNTLLNILIVQKDEDVSKEKEKAFEELMGILSEYNS